MYWLQITRHEELLRKARKRYTASKIEEGERGKIYDVNSNLMAGNYQCYNVYATPNYYKIHKIDLNNVKKQLQFFLQVPRQKLDFRFKFALKHKYGEAIVKRHVEISQIKKIKSLKDLTRGLRIKKVSRRFYPKGEMLSHIIGYLSYDEHSEGLIRPQLGIEKAFNKLLSPTIGTRYYEKTARGEIIYCNDFSSLKPQNGCDIYLTMEEPIQHILDEELQKLVLKFKPKVAYALMVNPKNGRIMGISQHPTFNLNKLTEATADKLRNRVLGDGFEPGSVMKAISIAGAFDYNIVSLDSKFDCEKGSWYHASKILHDSGHSYSILSVREIIQKSSNIGTAKIALKMGKNRLWQTLNRFGFGRKTGISLPGEASGIFRKLKKWDSLSITRFSIGQGILVTPLQLVQAYSALANEGIMCQPHIIDRIIAENGITKTTPTLKMQRVLRKSSAKKMTEALKLVTKKGGTGTKAAVPGYEVAGKTGTGQKFVDGAYSHSKYVSSFIGYVPADNPAFVLLVVADEPSKISYYGGTVSGPTFRRISEQTLKYLEVSKKQN
ncbi:MAG: penicillin-binding protein 2 [Verrucomicrobiota bacterium]|nr:penicillin-binding protein 2 [Verrucomicrobiota bacterium]